MGDEEEEEWTSVTYHISMILEKSKLMSENLKMELQLTKDALLASLRA